MSARRRCITMLYDNLCHNIIYIIIYVPCGYLWTQVVGWLLLRLFSARLLVLLRVRILLLSTSKDTTTYDPTVALRLRSC